MNSKPKIFAFDIDNTVLGDCSAASFAWSFTNWSSWTKKPDFLMKSKQYDHYIIDLIRPGFIEYVSLLHDQGHVVAFYTRGDNSLSGWVSRYYKCFKKIMSDCLKGILDLSDCVDGYKDLSKLISKLQLHEFTVDDIVFFDDQPWRVMPQYHNRCVPVPPYSYRKQVTEIDHYKPVADPSFLDPAKYAEFSNALC